MKERALLLAQKLEWFSGKEIQDVDLKEIEQELAAVRREAIQEVLNDPEFRIHGLTKERILLLDRWEKQNDYSKMINEAIWHGIKIGQKQVMDQIEEQIRALNGPGTKGR